MSAKQIEERVMAVLSVWREWSIFAPIFLFGLEAAFTRSVADSALMTTFSSVEMERVVTKDELETVRRRARQMGVALSYRSPSNKQDILTDLEEVLQLEKKIQFVTDYAASRQVIPDPDEDDIDGVPYDPEDVDIDGVPFFYDDEDIDGVPFDPEIEASSLNAPFTALVDTDDDIDGVPIEDDIDGVPFEE
jgi:hypothetical protein